MRPLLSFAFFLGSSLASAVLHAEDLPDPRPKPALSTYLHIESNKPLTLRRSVGRFGQLLCEAPCDKTIAYDEKDFFSITGSFVEVMPFRIGPVGPRAELRVDASSKAMLYTGITASALGLSAGTLTAMIYILAVVGDALGSGNGVDPNFERPVFGAMIAGGVAVAIGVPLIFISQTKVEVLPNPQKTQARGMLTIQF